MGDTIIVGSKGVVRISAEKFRTFQKGDKVFIMCTCDRPAEPYDEFDFHNPKRHHVWCNRDGIVEDTVEAGSNWMGEPKVGIRGFDNEWLGDFLESEVRIQEAVA